eukprot:403372833
MCIDWWGTIHCDLEQLEQVPIKKVQRYIEISQYDIFELFIYEKDYNNTEQFKPQVNDDDANQIKLCKTRYYLEIDLMNSPSKDLSVLNNSYYQYVSQYKENFLEDLIKSYDDNDSTRVLDFLDQSGKQSTDR